MRLCRPAVLAASLAALSSLLLADAPAPSMTALTAHIASNLAAHRAVYQLKLGSARDGDIVAATGSMSYEVIDACDGWAVQQRLDITITNRDGDNVQMVSDYATWEAKNGLKLRFRTRQTTDTAVTQVTSGEASLHRPGGDGEIHYDQPQESDQKLPRGTLFPMWHTATIIAAAEQGKRMIALPLFDGTSDTGAQDSSIFITNWQKPQPSRYPALAQLPSGRVHIAFFDHNATTAEPDYEVGMKYWENGVADDLQMDFGDFLMDGTLSDFHLQPPRHCAKNERSN